MLLPPPPLPPPPPFRTYECRRTTAPIVVDGDINKPAWQAFAWSQDFVDIEGDLRPLPRLRTRIKMCWDDTYFYIAAEMDEPHVWATLTQRDSVIFHDNDFEVFLNPSKDSKNYYELEVNALNTVWDLLLRETYRAGGKADNSFTIVGLQTAVKVRGTLNNPSDIDQGWDVEIALPWAAFTAHDPPLEPGMVRPAPAENDVWKVNFSRVQWETVTEGDKYTKVPGKREDNWVWSPMGLVDMHLPDRWGEVVFKPAPAPTSDDAQRHGEMEPQKPRQE